MDDTINCDENEYPEVSWIEITFDMNAPTYITDNTCEQVPEPTVTATPAGPEPTERLTTESVLNELCVDRNTGAYFTCVRRRRSFGSCDDGLYEFSIVPFQLSLDMETFNFEIEMENRVVYSEYLNISMIHIGLVQIWFNEEEIDHLVVANMRHETFPMKYSTWPKRKYGFFKAIGSIRYSLYYSL